MTVSSTTSKTAPMQGNGVTTTFPFSFKADADADVYVVHTDSDGIETILTQTSQYTISRNADQKNSPGGSVTYPVSGSPLPSGEYITIYRSLTAIQSVDLENQGEWNPETVEGALDRAVMLIQQVDEKADRAVKVDISSGTDPDQLIDDILQAKVDAEAAKAAAETAQAAAEAARVILNTVAELKAATGLSVGQLVATAGYTSAGDGGNNLYQIVAAGTGTDDGGSYIDLSGSGLQAKGLFPGGVVNVKQFGAVGDGVTDDSPAIQNALNATDVVYIPSGAYYVASNLLRTGAVSIYGDGIGKSILLCDTGSGITVTGIAGDNSPTEIRHISILQAGALSTGAALKVDNSAQVTTGYIQNRTSPRLLVRDVAIKGNASVTNSGWLVGVEAISVLHADISGLHFEGRYDSTPDNILSTDAIKLYGAGMPVELLVKDSWVFYANNAVHATDCEGVLVDNCTFVGVNTGVRFDPAAMEPHLDVHSCHVNSNAHCVYAKNLIQGNIRGNLLYARNTAVSNVVGIQLDNCTWTDISNNVFVNTSSYDYNTTVVTNNGEGCNINGNIYKSATTAIWLKASSTKVRVGSNTYGNITNNNILNQGTLNRIINNSTTVRRTSSYSLQSGTLIALPFESVLTGTSEYFNISNPTRLTAPVDGVYEISGVVIFANNGTGYRKAVIRKNALAIIGYPQGTTVGSGAVNDAITLCTTRVTLAAGDYIELLAYQNTGSTMTLPVAETSLTLTYIAEE